MHFHRDHYKVVESKCQSHRVHYKAVQSKYYADFKFLCHCNTMLMMAGLLYVIMIFKWSELRSLLSERDPNGFLECERSKWFSWIKTEHVRFSSKNNHENWHSFCNNKSKQIPIVVATVTAMTFNTRHNNVVTAMTFHTRHNSVLYSRRENPNLFRRPLLFLLCSPLLWRPSLSFHRP